MWVVCSALRGCTPRGGVRSVLPENVSGVFILSVFVVVDWPPPKTGRARLQRRRDILFFETRVFKRGAVVPSQGFVPTQRPSALFASIFTRLECHSGRGAHRRKSHASGIFFWKACVGH